MQNSFSQQPVQTPDRQPRFTGERSLMLLSVSLAGLALAGCSATPPNAQTGTDSSSTVPESSAAGASNSAQESTTPLKVTSSETATPPLTPTSLPTTTLSEVCQLDTGSIYSGGKFNQGNKGDIADQLSALDVAKNNQPVRFADVRHASSLLTNATIDDKYAAGLTIANDSPAGAVPSVETLLADVAALPPDACPSQTQVKQIGGLFQTIIHGYGPKITDQSAIDVRVVYSYIKTLYEKFKVDHPEVVTGN